MSAIKKLASQTAVYGISSIMGRLLNYLLVPLYTRAFTPTEYGVVTEYYAYVSFLVIALTYGMETAFFNFSKSETDKGKVYSTSLISLVGTSLFFVAIMYMFDNAIATALHYPQHPEYIRWFAIIIAIDALTAIPFARLREENRAKRFAFVKLFNIGINIFFNVFFIVGLQSAKSIGIVGLYKTDIGVGYIFIANLIASIVTLILLYPQFRIKYKFDFALWKRMLRYAVPLLFAGLAGMVNETMDRILLKYLIPDNAIAMHQIGIYGACYKVSIMMTIFIQAYRFAAEPFFFSQAKEHNAKDTYAETMNYFVIVCAFIFLAIMMYIDVVQYFVGEDYREGLKVVPILLLANLFLGVFFNLSIWYKLSGKTLYGTYLTFFGAFITLILNYMLIPKMGYMGAAWTTLICYALMALASYIVGQKHYPVNYNLKKTGGYLALSLGLFFVREYLTSKGVHLSLMTNTIFLLVFVATVVGVEYKATKAA